MLKKHSFIIFASTAGLLFLTPPFALVPFGSERFVVPQKDEAGGSGVDFIVKWHSAESLSPPIIETIMIGTQNQLVVSFAS